MRSRRVPVCALKYADRALPETENEVLLSPATCSSSSIGLSRRITSDSQRRFRSYTPCGVAPGTLCEPSARNTSSMSTGTPMYTMNESVGGVVAPVLAM